MLSYAGWGQVTITTLPHSKSDNFDSYNPPYAANETRTLPLRWIYSRSTNYPERSIGTGNQGGFYGREDVLILPDPATAFFRSKTTTGKWNVPGSWESSADGITDWNTATVAPTQTANTITIRSGNNITIDTNVTLDQLVIESAGQLSVNINSGKLTINDDISNDIDIQTNGILQVFATVNDSNIRYTDKIIFSGSSSINVDGKILIGNGNNFMGGGYGGFGFAPNTQVIWNHNSILEWNTTGSLPNFTNGTYFPGANATTIPNFRITKIQGGDAGGTATSQINGMVQLNGANLSWGGTGVKIFRNGIKTTGSDSMLLGTSTGKWQIGDGNPNVSAELGGATGNLTLTNANGLTIANSCYARLTSSLKLGTNTKFTVESGATLDFGFNGTTALNILASGNGQTFTAAMGSTLKITSPFGITTSVASATAGNVQVPTDSRTFDKGATYHYIGKANQVTGNGIPDQIKGKLIVELDTQNTTQDDLEFRSTGTTTFGTTGSVNGILEIRKGKVFDEPGKGFRNFMGTVDPNEDGESDTQKGNIIMTGGRYVISGSGIKPSLSGNYTFSAGTVEFTGSAATKIRTSSPAKQYYNVDISGSNVESGGKNFIVNNLLKVTSATTVLTIPEVSDSVAPYVVTAKKGIQVASGGQALLKNNAQLMQYADAVNSGNISVIRKSPMKKSNYTYWSSPVSGQKLQSFSPATNSTRFYEYIESTNLFKTVPWTNDFISGKGYAIMAPTTYTSTTTNTDFEGKFVGVPTNDIKKNDNTDLKIPVTLSPGADQGYNLIGNPYPSNIDFESFHIINSGIIFNTAYFWTNVDPNRPASTNGNVGYSGNAYAIYNGTGGISSSTTSIPGRPVPTQYIKVGQGFIVKAKAGGDLIFNNAIRNTTGNSVFFSKEANSEKDRFWLKLTSPSQNVNTILVGYIQGASNNFEWDYDAPLFSVASDSFYSILGSEKLGIQGKTFPLNVKDTVPLGTKHFETGIYTLSLGDQEGVFANGQNVYVKDKSTGIVHNLTASNYVFQIEQGIYENRFEIIYEPESVLSTGENLKDNLVVYRNADHFIIKAKENISSLQVYDLTGKLLFSINPKSTVFEISAGIFANGTYILRIDRNGHIIHKKIIK